MPPHAPMIFIGQLTLVIYFIGPLGENSCAYLFTNVGKFPICNVKPKGFMFLWARSNLTSFSWSQDINQTMELGFC